jgi:tetratricopeptide (TPR) repeat protein
VVNRGWARPAANLGTGRSTTVKHGNTSNDRRPYHGRGYDGWHHHRLQYAWGGYSSSSYYPYYYNSYPYSASYSDGGSSLSSGSLNDSGASGSSDPAASSSPGSSDEGAASTDKETVAAARRRDQARRAFQKGDYVEAQRECERAIRLLPGDANLHEFRALCQFARGQSTDAAGTLYEVLAAGPGWDWSTLSSFYTSPQTYTTQLRALERYVRESPKDAAGRFVLAYHYLALGERDAAARQLREVIKLQPRDQVSPGILEALEKARRPAPGREPSTDE